ncbi:MAG: S8 family serine peptidase [Armatimonadota bacterium]|nr:S8 family serine peptidase [Armatimonadota bacterium]
MKRPSHFVISGFVVFVLFLISCCASFAILDQEAGVPAQPQYRPDRILVKPKRGLALFRLEELHGQHGVRVRRIFARIGNLQVIELPKGAGVLDLIDKYNKSGLVEYAEPDYIVSTCATEPNDPKYVDGTLWSLNNTGQNGGTADADIDAPEGWDIIHDAPTVIVAVIDTGARYTHEDLAANMWSNPGETPGNGIDDDGNVYVDDVYGINAITASGNPNDDNGHGTHVSGTIGAVGNNSKGVAGVAWRVKIMACKFADSGGSGYTSDEIECIDYAISKGAHIINASWGGPNYNQSLYDAIAAARDAGIIFVAAAGNGGSDQIGDNNDIVPEYPASYDLDNIVSVAATDRNDGLASFSNYGLNSVDLGAPGASITSAVNTSDSAYGVKSGTSMAAPHVSGALALLAAAYPGDTYSQLTARLLTTTDPIPALDGKCQTDGRLNLYGALTLGTLPDWQCSTDVPKSIPDLSTVTSTLTISDPDCIQDLNVKLKIIHTWDSDLDVYLIHPDGTRVELFTDVGVSGDNFTDTVLDDEAATSITLGTAPFTGTYRPEGTLSSFDGKPAAGQWTLEITDDTASDTGTLQSWCLLMTTGQCVPRVTNVTSATNGCYGPGSNIDITVTFSQAVCFTGAPQLELETGASDRMANCVSGSGDTLTFRYTVQAGDTASDLCYKTTGSLTLNGGTITDCAGANASLTLPIPGLSGSLCYNNAIVIDTSAPTVSVNRLNPSGQSTNLQSVVWRVTFNEAVTGVDTVEPWDFALRVVLGPISGAHIVSVSPVSSTVYDVTVDTGSGDGELALDVPPSATIYDCGNNDYNSTYTTGQTYKIDRTACTVTNVTSSTLNGAYNALDVISIQVTFSEVVYVTVITGAPRLELETGAIKRKANYSSGSASSTLTFTYTVQAGDVSPDLDYTSINALELNGGTIRDAAGNNANLTLPAPGGPNSLSDNKDIVIDTDTPVAPSKPDLDPSDDTGESNSDDCTRNTTGLTLAGTAEAGSTVKIWNGGPTPLGSGTATGGAYSVNISLSAGTTTVTATATDAAGNQSAASEGLPICVDTSAPVSAAGSIDCGYTSPAFDVPFVVSDTGCAGMGAVGLWYRSRPLSGGAWGAWVQYPGSYPSSPVPFDSNTAGGDGEYEFYTLATDRAGNPEAAPPSADCGTKILTTGLAAPILSPEPVRTPGDTNQICWTGADPAATLYQGQCSRDAGFAGVDQDTGWQPRPPDCHTFAELLLPPARLMRGTDYYFRVRSGYELCPAASGSWSQTSQADFDTDTRNNVSTSASPGDVTLAGSGGPPVSNVIGSSTVPYSGSLRYRLNCFNCTSSRTLTQIEIYLNITSTQLQFVVYESATQSGTYSQLHSSTVASSGTGAKFYSSGPISVALQAGKYYLIGAAWQGSVTYYSGSAHPVAVAFGNSVAAYTGAGYPAPSTLIGTNATLCYYYRLTSEDNSAYLPAGNITSVQITPSPFAKWGALNYTRDTSAAGTALTVDVLDGATGAPLLEDVASGADLDAAGVTASSIKLRANLSTTNSSNTPKLSDWQIAYVASDPTIVLSNWSNIESSSQLRICGLPNKLVGNAMVGLYSDRFAFRLLGRVNRLDADSFELNDGSGPVRVVAPGHSLQTGDYAAATGILDASGNPPVLMSEPGLLQKVQ